MNDNDKPFSVRGGFAPGTLRMDNPDTLHRIWGAVYDLVDLDDSLQVLQEVWVFSASWIDHFRKKHQAINTPPPLSSVAIPLEIPLGSRGAIAEWRELRDRRHADALADMRKVIEDRWMSAHENGEWFRFYDMCEFLIAHGSQGREIAAAIQRKLDMHNIGGQLVNGKFIPALSREEAGEVGRALTVPFPEARTHMEKAVSHFRNRERPDYANTVKEAISAVESLVKEWTGKEIRSGLHQLARDEILRRDPQASGEGSGKRDSLVAALENVWGFATKSRHGLKSGESEPDAAEAGLILAVCASFVNYMTARKLRDEKSAPDGG